MTKETSTRADKIKSAFSTGEKIVGISNHPNSQSAEMMKQLNRAGGRTGAAGLGRPVS